MKTDGQTETDKAKLTGKFLQFLLGNISKTNLHIFKLIFFSNELIEILIIQN